MISAGNKCVYQIYPKSFYDSDNDGYGDLSGIIEKLDYISSLGVDYIWLTPFFISPQKDNGYDVADYCKVDERFGTMADLDELIAKASERNIYLMLDMVFNHTSTEHEWFKKALKGERKYQDYYIFRDGNEKLPPTNWKSKFGGSAWQYVPSLKKWYLHLFDASQADLNWDNPEVRKELKDIILFWKKKNIRGFRFDVINLISKSEDFIDDEEGDGKRFYTDGPHVHEYIKELVHDTGIEDYFTVGEMSATTIDNGIKYTSANEKELAMCFHFQHLKVDYEKGQKWTLMKPDINELKQIFSLWQEGMEKGSGWDALFYCNHDQPRISSRFGDEGVFWDKSCKMIVASLHLMRGTPYIYQGEELGMTNPHYCDIGDYRDVESLNYYKEATKNGVSKEMALKVLDSKSRDNGRTPMQWTNEKYGGFSHNSPWIKPNANYDRINVKEEERDSESVLNFYRQLVRLRKSNKIISEGSIAFFNDVNPEVLCYVREYEGQHLVCLFNYSPSKVKLDLSSLKDFADKEGKLFLSNQMQMNQMPMKVKQSLDEYEALALLYRD